MMPARNSDCLEIEIEFIYRLYLGLARFMRHDGIGGKLLYAGPPDAAGCQLLRAANVAGAASLAASGDTTALRDALRSGAIDFIVNSLDEALRILKNELRKQQPVAVGVSIAPETLLSEMRERGVQPDLLAPALHASPELDAFVARGACLVEPQAPAPGTSFNVISIPEGWTQPAAAFDALLFESLEPEDAVNRRWVRLAPRYLPSQMRRLRSLACKPGALPCSPSCPLNDRW